MPPRAQIVAKQAIDRLLGRKDKDGKGSRSADNSSSGDEEAPFFGQTRPRSHSLPKTGLSGISFTSSRPNLLPAVTRNSTGGSGLMQSPRSNKTLLFLGMATALISLLTCIFMLFSRPVRPPLGQLSEPPSEPVLTVADVILRSRKVNITASTALSETAPRVALCFFGLTRSLKFTLPSIELNILQPLREAGFRPTVFLHTYDDMGVDEQSQQAQADEWKILKPFRSIVTSQAQFLNTHSSEMDHCWQHGTGWTAAAPQTQQKNLRNLLCQLHSLKEVGKLWQAQFDAYPEQYAAVAFMRPDVFYRDPFPTHLISRLHGHAHTDEDSTEAYNNSAAPAASTVGLVYWDRAQASTCLHVKNTALCPAKADEVYVPAWGSYSGINDRFALLAPSGAAKWKRRMDFSLQQCLVEPIHAEVFAQRFATSAGFRVKKLSEFVFYRVRSNSEIAPGDYQLPGLNTTRLHQHNSIRHKQPVHIHSVHVATAL